MQTTKKRYREKKHLLESHMTTEEKLTVQANDLIRVADTATEDTHRLHETIERRRTIDANIQTVSERHAQDMDQELALFSKEMEKLMERHEPYSKLLVEDISKNTCRSHFE